MAEKILRTRVGLVIPTLQLRLDYLQEALDSIQGAGISELVVVSPKPPLINFSSEEFLVTWVTCDASLPESVNIGVSHLSQDITHFGWIGDDDSLRAVEFKRIITSETLGPLTVGYCEIVDSGGELLWVQRPSTWRLRRTAMSFFASPIAQPATIIGRQEFERVGGASSEFPLAFDHDLFFRLVVEFGTPNLLKFPFAKYRTHPGTLSESRWEDQLKESMKIRGKFTTFGLKFATRTLDLFRLAMMRFIRGTKPL